MTDLRDFPEEAIDNARAALESPSFPCNPIPFATALGALVAQRGTDSIRSDDAKRILWILIAQAYGQMARVDLCDEWDRLVRGERRAA